MIPPFAFGSDKETREQTSCRYQLKPGELALTTSGITNSASLAEWMFPNDFEPRVRHHFTFRVPPNPKMNFDGLVVHCEALECEPPSRLAFPWEAGGLVGTQVSFQLEPDDEGTRVLFEHSGFDASQPW